MGCLHGACKVAILIGRWGGWPSYTTLLLRTIASNSLFDFFFISDRPPADSLPPNAKFSYLTLTGLLQRLNRSVGLRLHDAAALRVEDRFRPIIGGISSKDYSAAKTNDLKPLWGEAFADLLDGYRWWGYAQEDILLGNLSACISPFVLENFDVISPERFPYNASGTFMLLRNTPHITRLWRGSMDVGAILSDPTYAVFDEWWGPARDHFPKLIGKEVAAGRLRLWFLADWHGRDAHIEHAMTVCWWKGHLYANARFVATATSIPCFGFNAIQKDEMCLWHLIRYKQLPQISALQLDKAADRALRNTNEFALARDGVWIPGSALGLAAGGSNLSVLYNDDSPTPFDAAALRRHFQHADQCDDRAANPRVAQAMGLPLSGSWCWQQRSQHRGLCKHNQTVRHMCVRTCMLCQMPTVALSSHRRFFTRRQRRMIRGVEVQ
mmetsp:Transcript_63142/g.104995  ORF Transcript_63142/g.104995 Transcript_63142/m.104995 type:complete len:438 (+) Transcript_63142:189-1502(+)